jgi:hypothetical protein
MKNTIMPLMLAASMLASACTYNIAVEKSSNRVYRDTDLKTVVTAAIGAINRSHLSVQTTNTPVAGLVVIAAKGTENRLFQIDAPRLTLTLAEVHPSRIRVDASAILPGQTSDFGLTDHMITSVFKAMDAQLDTAGQADHDK